MSIKTVDYFLHVCDCCNAEADYGDYSAWSSIDGADASFPEDWAQTGGLDLCDDCWTWADPDNNYDDPIRAHDTHPQAVTP